MKTLFSKINNRWTWLCAILIFVFTLIKIPPLNLGDFVQSYIEIAMNSAGIQYSADEVDVSLLFGPKLTFKNVAVAYGSSPPVDFDRLEISPSVLSALMGEVSVDLDMKKQETKCEAEVDLNFGSMGKLIALGGSKNPTKDLKSYRIEFDAKKVDLRSLGVLERFAQVSGGGSIDAKGWIKKKGKGKGTVPDEGEFDLKISNFAIDEQTVFTFKVPALSVSAGEASGQIQDGNLNIKKFTLGKTGSEDDIVASVDGKIKLKKNISKSELDLRAKFSISEKIRKAFRLIDTFLAAGKQSDGSFSYELKGPLSFPNPKPLR